MQRLLAIGLLVALLAGCASAPSAPTVLQPGADGGYDIAMNANRFFPANAQVPVGASVTWTNNEQVPHDVNGVNGATFSSDAAGKKMAKDDTFTYAFTAAGTYSYVCKIHESQAMKGTITVV
ncbi:MAG: plastocyanin/azurin family copper-binding protein [Candidatus Thermoplasmatota archaeon]